MHAEAKALLARLLPHSRRRPEVVKRATAMLEAASGRSGLRRALHRVEADLGFLEAEERAVTVADTERRLAAGDPEVRPLPEPEAVPVPDEDEEDGEP